MVYCCGPLCHSEKGKVEGVTFHEFPSEEERRLLWLKNITVEPQQFVILGDGKGDMELQEKSDDEGENVDLANQIREELRIADKHLHIKSKESAIHIGPKFYFGGNLMENESNLEKLYPMLQSIAHQRQLRQDAITDEEHHSSENSQPLAKKTNQQEDFSETTLYSDGDNPIDQNSDKKSKLEALCFKKNTETESLLTPEYFQTSVNAAGTSNPFYVDPMQQAAINNLIAHQTTTAPLAVNPQVSYYPSFPSYHPGFPSVSQYYPSDTDTGAISTSNMHNSKTQAVSSANNFPFAHPKQQSIHYSTPTANRTHYANTPFSPNLHLTKNSAEIHKSFYLQKLKAHSLESSDLPQNASNAGNTATSYEFSRKQLQTTFSVPSELKEYIKATGIDSTKNLSRVRILKERPKDNWIPMRTTYMEERNFKLGIIPGIFYNTENGVLVEMTNGAHYDILLTNGNVEQCDVDLYVDTHLVQKLRLDGNSSELLDGPRQSSARFVFIRAFDAPPEAEIAYRDEGNGLIEAIFKPEKKADDLERRRAWSEAIQNEGRNNGLEIRRSSLGPAVSCNESLHRTLQNILDPENTSWSRSTPTSELSYKYRSGKLCSGATALQGKQKEKFSEDVDDIEIDESRVVLLQLRLVARDDDPSKPKTDEPITPLITKRPPPMPF